MVQIGERSLGPSPPRPPAPAPAPAPGVGSIRVEVTRDSICWDTTPDGLPQAFQGATVRASSGGVTRTGTTDINGTVTLEELPTGSCTVEVSAPRYRSAGPFTETISAGATQVLTTSLRRTSTPGHTVCNRQHTPVPPGSPTPGYLPWIFWHSAFMIVIREIAWLILLVAFAVFLVIAIVDMADGRMDLPLGGFSLPAMLLGAAAYLTHVIFGTPVGVPTIVVAGLSWLALIGLTIAAAVGALPMLPINLVWFPSLCGMWVCFFIMLAIRFDTFEVLPGWPLALLYALISVAVALPLYFVLAATTAPALWANASEVVGFMFLVLIVSYVGGLVSGISGHVFNNDHNLTAFTPHGEPKLLPYAGYRFCVQGNRGWFSHFRKEELCYDFAVPTGTHVLAIEEGHVIEWRDDRVHSYYDTGRAEDQQANYIYVEHKDGSVAHYLHLVKDGVRNINPVLVANSTGSGPVYRSDVHVHAGQVLALAGHTGISRFPHIHLGLYRDTTTSGKLGLTFRDASTQAHGGKCYTFRPYQSDNADRGPIAI